MRTLSVLSLAVVAVAAMGSWASAESVKIGDAAPGFTAVGVDGKEVSLKSALKGAEAVVVCFTCNKCPIAIAHEDRFIEFTKTYKDKKVRFVALNCNNADEDLERMKERAEEKGFNFLYAFDTSGDAARDFGATRTPEMYLIDAKGNVQYHGGFDNKPLGDKPDEPTKTYLINAVDAVLAGKKPEVAETRAIGCGIALKR